jgi:hypothetical protein
VPVLENRSLGGLYSSNSTPESTSSPYERLDLAAGSANLLSAGGFTGFS